MLQGQKGPITLTLLTGCGVRSSDWYFRLMRQLTGHLILNKADTAANKNRASSSKARLCFSMTGEGKEQGKAAYASFSLH